MKRFIVGVFAIASSIGPGLSAEIGAPQSLTSVAQYSDATPDRPYFTALQSLVERYGVANGFKTPSGVAFRGEQALSRADMIMLIDASLDQVAQLAEMTLMEMPPEQRDQAMRKLPIMQGAMCKPMAARFDSVKQIKDVKASDPWFQASVNLVEKWSIRIASSDGTFGPADAVGVDDARACLKIFSPKGPASRSGSLTRGDFAIMLNEALEDFTDGLAGSDGR
jgi:hypothetical protein